jgi:hypothetical protein
MPEQFCAARKSVSVALLYIASFLRFTKHGTHLALMLSSVTAQKREAKKMTQREALKIAIAKMKSEVSK